MYRFHHKKLPTIFSNLFTFNRDIHERLTKQSDLIHVPNIKHCKLVIRQRAMRFVGVSAYNFFHKKVEMDVEPSTYKKHLKSYLLDLDIALLSCVC